MSERSDVEWEEEEEAGDLNMREIARISHAYICSLQRAAFSEGVCFIALSGV
jgi:hypothetical protein